MPSSQSAAGSARWAPRAPRPSALPHRRRRSEHRGRARAAGALSRPPLQPRAPTWRRRRRRRRWRPALCRHRRSLPPLAAAIASSARVSVVSTASIDAHGSSAAAGGAEIRAVGARRRVGHVPGARGHPRVRRAARVASHGRAGRPRRGSSRGRARALEDVPRLPARKRRRGTNARRATASAARKCVLPSLLLPAAGAPRCRPAARRAATLARGGWHASSSAGGGQAERLGTHVALHCAGSSASARPSSRWPLLLLPPPRLRCCRRRRLLPLSAAASAFSAAALRGALLPPGGEASFLLREHVLAHRLVQVAFSSRITESALSFRSASSAAA